MGKLTISMAIFNSYVKLPEGISFCHGLSPLDTKKSYPSNDWKPGNHSHLGKMALSKNAGPNP